MQAAPMSLTINDNILCVFGAIFSPSNRFAMFPSSPNVVEPGQCQPNRPRGELQRGSNSGKHLRGAHQVKHAKGPLPGLGPRWGKQAGGATDRGWGNMGGGGYPIPLGNLRGGMKKAEGDFLCLLFEGWRRIVRWCGGRRSTLRFRCRGQTEGAGGRKKRDQRAAGAVFEGPENGISTRY